MFQFVQRRKLYFAISGGLLGLGIVAMIVSWLTLGVPLRLGVDFLSGTRFEYQFLEPTTETALRDVFTRDGIENPIVTSLQGEGLENAWQIRAPFVVPEKVREIEADLLATIGPVREDATRVDSVSPAVGAEVTRSAVVAILFASGIILFYIMFSFRQIPNSFRYGVCAVIAMLHDLLMILGFAAITGMILGWEVDALFLTAILTVAGFSLQDTIVVFDRIRENIAKRPTENFETTVNRSVLETIHRSLATQLCAMFIMVALLLFGGASILPFIAVLFIGLLSGTYSSIFTAVPLLVEWEQRAARAEG